MIYKNPNMENLPFPCNTSSPRNAHGKINNMVKAKYVVLASHYPFINFPGVYFAKMYQSSSYVIGIDIKSELFDGMYINIQSPIYSFRTAKDGNKKSLLLFMMCLFYYFTTFKNKLIEII